MTMDDTDAVGTDATRKVIRVHLRGTLLVDLPQGVDYRDEGQLGAWMEEMMASVTPEELGSAVEIWDAEVGTADPAGQFGEDTIEP